LVWSEERTTDAEFDLQEFVYGILERAKENLVNDGYLESGAWIIEPLAIHCYDVGHKSSEYRFEPYSQLAAQAKQLKAEAIVSLTDAYWGEQYDPSTYYHGKLAEEGRECIWISVTYPDKPSWSLQAKYKRSEKKIVFEPTEREEGEKNNLLGSWSKELREIQ
jgi:hypothetical protein